MVTIGGNEHGSGNPANRSPLIARVAGTVAATALIFSTGASVLAAGPAPVPKLASQVAVTSAGGGAAVTGGAISSIEVFPAGSMKNASPSQYLHGANTGLINPTDIKYAPGNAIVAVSNSAAALGGIPKFGGLTYIYSAALNGNQGPVQALGTLSTSIPDGVAWDAEGNLWVANFTTPSCLKTPAGTCTVGSKTAKPPIPPSPDLCGLGTLEEFEPNSAMSLLPQPNVMNPVPIRTLKACGFVNRYHPAYGAIIADMAGPVGMFVDEVDVQVCVPTDYPGDDACGTTLGGQPADIGEGGVVHTHRIFVVNGLASLAAPKEQGLDVAVYEPELAEAIADEYGAGKGLISDDFLVEAALGGSFGHGSLVNPQYLAKGIQPIGAEVYVTDSKGGPFGRGSIASFPTFPLDAFCAQPFGNDPDFSDYDCSVAVLNNTLEADPPSFIQANPNKHVTDLTGLKAPEGIAATILPGQEDDTLFVTNTLAGGILQFAPGATGNVKPQTTVGGNTNISKMIFPWGLSIPFGSATAAAAK